MTDTYDRQLQTLTDLTHQVTGSLITLDRAPEAVADDLDRMAAIADDLGAPCTADSLRDLADAVLGVGRHSVVDVAAIAAGYLAATPTRIVSDLAIAGTHAATSTAT